MPEGCPQEAGFVAGYLDGDWDGDVRRRFEEHVESCERCARKKRELVVVREALGSWEQPRLDDSEVEEYREAFRKALPTTWGRTSSDAVGWPPFRVAAWCAAAGVVGAISMAVFQWSFGGSGIRSDGPGGEPVVVASEDDGRNEERNGADGAASGVRGGDGGNGAEGRMVVASGGLSAFTRVRAKSMGVIRDIADLNEKEKRQRVKIKATVLMEEGVYEEGGVRTGRRHIGPPSSGR